MSAVFAHAAGTQAGDAAEVRALGAALGEALGGVPVTAMKSMTGHMLGASGAAQAVAAVKAIASGTVPPTINCEHLDDGLSIDCVRGAPRQGRCGSCCPTPSAFGGQNAALVFSAPPR